MNSEPAIEAAPERRQTSGDLTETALWVILPLLLLLMSASLEASSVILDVPHGPSGTAISAREDEETHGPESFFVSQDGQILICDTLRRRLLVFQGNVLVRVVPIPWSRPIIDFCLDDAGRIVFLDEAYAVVVTDGYGRLIDTRSVPKIEANSALVTAGGKTRRFLFEPESISVEANEIVIQFRNSKRYRLIDQHLERWEENRRRESGESSGPAGNDGARDLERRALGRDSLGRTFVRSLGYRSGGERLFDRVGVYKEEKLVGEGRLLPSGLFTPNRSVRMADGRIYQMVVSDSSTAICSIPVAPAGEENGASGGTITDSPHHGRLPGRSLPSAVVGTAVHPLQTRARVAYNAVHYAELTWSYGSANARKFVTNVPAWVTAPDWLAVPALNDGGSHDVSGIPYCWGGWDGLRPGWDPRWVSFADAMQKGFYAGNVQVDRSHPYIIGTAGMDCSGYATACWEFTQKHSTATLSDISGPGGTPPFHQITADEAEHLDILNRPGEHVMLLWGKTQETSGALAYAIYEASTRGDDAVRGRLLTPSQVAGYGFYRYKYWSDFAEGDVNQDGSVDVADLHVLLLQLTRGETIPHAALLLADANGDGDVNIADAARLLAIIRQGQSRSPVSRPASVW